MFGRDKSDNSHTMERIEVQFELDEPHTPRQFLTQTRVYCGKAIEDESFLATGAIGASLRRTHWYCRPRVSHKLSPNAGRAGCNWGSGRRPNA